MNFAFSNSKQLTQENLNTKNSINNNYSPTASITNSSMNGSTNGSKKYELKRWNITDTDDYLYNFYKYWKNDGVRTLLSITKPELRVPDNCKLDKLENDENTMTNIVLNNKQNDVYIIFAIDKCNINGFFVGKIQTFVFDQEKNLKKIIFADIHNPNIKISSEFNTRSNDNRILNHTQTGKYLKYIKTPTPLCGYDIFQEKWLVFKLSEKGKCLQDIFNSTIKDRPSYGGRRKSLNKSKKYARKTIRKHKSRKNRN